jgi:DNA-binding FrmR family transcriptional regulator
LCGIYAHIWFSLLLRGRSSPLINVYHIPLAYGQVKESMSHLEKEKQKLVARIKRIRGQVDSIERSLTSDDDCADVLMLLANVRGGINSLMAEVLEDHIRLHLLSSNRNSAPPNELAEDLIDLVRAYLK